MTDGDKHQQGLSLQVLLHPLNSQDLHPFSISMLTGRHILAKEKEENKTMLGSFQYLHFFWQMISDISIVRVWELPLTEELLLSLGVP